jgi:hypothetical protein
VPASKGKKKEKESAALRKLLGLDVLSSPSLSPIPSHTSYRPTRKPLRRHESYVYGDMYLPGTPTVCGSSGSTSATLFSPMRGASPLSIPSSAGYGTSCESSPVSNTAGEPVALLRAGKRLLRNDADNDDDVRSPKKPKLEAPDTKNVSLLDAIIPAYAIWNPPSPPPSPTKKPVSIFSVAQQAGAVKCILFTVSVQHLDF